MSRRTKRERQSGAGDKDTETLGHTTPSFRSEALMLGRRGRAAAEADEDAEAEREADWELASCCGGRDWFCGHYGCGVMTTRDYRDKYDCWDE